MTTRVYLVRHGATLATAEDRFSGAVDIELSDEGKEQGFRQIMVTEPSHAFTGKWWPPGHIIGYEHTFTHTVHDFLEAMASGKRVRPDFEDGVRNQLVLEAIEKSAASKRWVSVPAL